jgi:hypothetical protein
MKGKSSQKNADIKVAPCQTKIPVTCGDAYEYTWTEELSSDLISLSSQNLRKLVQSMGFCPQLRCQLDNVSNSDITGECPDGLCFSKLEDGSPSFGACCFKNGTFLSGNIIGFYKKLQKTPKPIYRHSRVVLGGNHSDTSYESFINANYIYPHIIATQCPLIPSDYNANGTLDDVKRMIIEQNITHWIQLAPDTNPLSPRENSNCANFLFEFFGNLSSESSLGISNFTFVNREDVFSSKAFHANVSYTLTAYTRKSQSEYNSVETVFQKPIQDDEESWAEVVRHVRHIWYFRWKDFQVPPVEDDEVEMMMMMMIVILLLLFYE